MTVDAKELLKPEVLATQDHLTEEQVDALHTEAVAELRTPKPDTKVKEETAPENEETQKAPELSEEEKKVKEAADLKTTNEALLVKPDKELSEQEKAKKAILVRDKAEAELTLEAESLSKESEGKVTLEDAKKEIVSRNKVAEKYKNDPKAMAKALLHGQREFLKVQAEVKTLKESPRPSQLKTGEAIIDGKLHTADEVREILVTGYKEENPKLTEGLDDDKVYDLAVAQIREKQSAMQETSKKELVVNAKEKRGKSLATITDSEKEYAEEITNLVNETPDHVIMSEEWSFDDVKAWARGRYFSEDKLNEIRQEGFKKGREEAEILGTKEGDAKPGSGAKPPVKQTAGSRLTNDQKERARAMYRTEGLTEDDKFAMYADYLDHQKKLKK